MSPANLGIIAQFFQPYFYFSVVFSAIAFICTRLLLRDDCFLGRKTRSIVYLIPITIPIVVMLFFHPETVMRMIESGITGVLVKFDGASLSGSSQAISPNILLEPAGVPSITGILCLVGLTLAAAYFIAMIALDDRIAAKIFHIITLTPDEYQPLQRKVNEISQKLAIRTPQIGIIEDLRPNAFVTGHGRRAMLVFSLGILNILNEEELVAVAAHELAHIKNHDSFFKTVSYALTMASFYSPFAYFTVSAVQKERELLADESGARLLKQPMLLSKALAKLYAALRAFPRESRLASLTSNLLLVSPITRRPEILATHPRVSQRVRNIARLTSKPVSVHRNVAITLALSFLIVLGGIATSYSLASLRASLVQNASFASLQPSIDENASVRFLEGLNMSYVYGTQNFSSCYLWNNLTLFDVSNGTYIFENQIYLYLFFLNGTA
ncbi:MAG TPA: M48 family metalloprotease [Candidatus Bathyarchaeia archaeon]